MTSANELGIDRLIGQGLIGRGGQASVYRALDPQLHREVAVKLFSSESNAADVERELSRELRALGPLTGHPHIVTVFRTGVTDQDRPYVEMEYLGGGSLWARIKSGGPMPESEVARIGSQVASALAAAHALGMTHRDVKPSNILLSTNGDAKLADFGIASVGGGTTTVSDQLRYTLAYAPPEVLAGGAATPGGDVYSLALTLIAGLSGYAPFQQSGDSSIQQLIGRIMANDVPDPKAAGASDRLAELLQRALAATPGSRPTAEAMTIELQALVMAAPPPASRPAVGLLPPPRPPTQDAAGVGGGSADLPDSDATVVRRPASVKPAAVTVAAADTTVLDIAPGGSQSPAAGGLESPPWEPASAFVASGSAGPQSQNGSRRKLLLIGIPILILALLGVGVALLSSGGGDSAGDSGQATATSATTIAATTTAPPPATTAAPTAATATASASTSSASTATTGTTTLAPSTTSRSVAVAAATTTATTAATTVTVKPACVTVPNVIGNSVPSATSAITAKGLKASSVSGYKSGSFFNVYKSSPTAGACVSKGTKVKIYWSDPNNEP